MSPKVAPDQSRTQKMETFYVNETNREFSPRKTSNVNVTLHHRRDAFASSRASRSIGQCVSGGSTSNFLEDPRSNLVSGLERQASSSPWSLQYRTPYPRGYCVCQCTRGSWPTAKVKDLPTAEHNKKSSLSSWRLLHMTRAKLKGSASTSELLAGFATVAMVEVNIHSPTLVPEWLFVVFAATTSLLVSVHIFALMISTYVLPNIDAIFMIHPKGAIIGAPHESMRLLVDLAWTFSTLLGLFLFLFDVAVICWIQLLDFSFTASLVGSLIVGPVMIACMAIVVHFHKKLIVG